MFHSTVCWYTCVTFPYRLPVHHFHFDIAGDAELKNIDCEKSTDQRDLEDMCWYVMREREREKRLSKQIYNIYLVEATVAYFMLYRRYSASV